MNNPTSNAAQIVADARTLRDSLVHRLDQFTAYLDSWAKAIEEEGADLDKQIGAVEVTRFMEQIESVTHIHTGSTDHMHYRTLRDHLLSHLAGNDITRGW